MVLQAISFFTILKFILIAYGHVKDFPTSHLEYALCSSVYRAGTPCRNGRKALPAILPKDTSQCVWQASISVNWAVGGVCKVFACLLGS